MFAPLAKLVLRIDDPRRIPEYIARAWATAMAGRPGPVVIALPEDMLLEQVAASAPRPALARPAQAVCPDALGTLMRMLEDACAPVAIVGGAGWHAKAREHFTSFAERIGLPVAGAFRRQDAVPNASPVWAGNLGYGPNPKLVERIKQADLVLVVGARLGEATTDSYSLITPDHPGQLLVHVHPDPEELGRVYRPDLALCADMAEFAEAADLWDDDIVPFEAGKEAHQQWLDWSTPQPNGHRLDMGQVVAAMRASLPGDAIICNGAGNFSGWWHRFWHYDGFPSQLAPTAGAMGYGVPAAVAAAKRFPERTVVALAGDGDFLMNGQELATAMQYGCDMIVVLVDNAAYGTIRMHQEREFPERVSATALQNPDFAALARAYGGWAQRVETNAEFDAALAEAKDRKGLRLLHLVIDIEQLSAGGASVSGLRAKAAK
jgi:acetolactate synthase-1/2/3 large subunit